MGSRLSHNTDKRLKKNKFFMRSFSMTVNSFFSMSFMPVVLFVGTFLFPQIVFLDAPLPWQIGFQDPATPIAQGIQDLHHDICFFYGGCSNFCNLDVMSYFMAFSLDKESRSF